MLGSVLVWRSLNRALRAESGIGLAAEAKVDATSLRGVFVVFEGGDGAGKSTQIRLLRSAVERAGHRAVVTREPGGTRLGEAVRELLLQPSVEDMDERSEALLYAAARAQHVREVIVPALQRGNVVLCDRYIDSSVVYQGAARGLGEERIVELNRWATGAVEPDLVVLLDVDPAAGLARAVGEGAPDRLESAGLGFHRAVRGAYRRRAAADPERYLVLDADQPVEAIHARVRQKVTGLLGLPPAEAVEVERSRRQGHAAPDSDAMSAATDPSPQARAEGRP